MMDLKGANVMKKRRILSVTLSIALIMGNLKWN